MLNTLRENAKSILDFAYSPYSNFQVAACIIDSDGKLYTGNNIENASYGLTICAERSACVKMFDSPTKPTISEILILCSNQTLITPCGACLQFIGEFCVQETLVHCAYGKQFSETKTWHFAELMPHTFLLPKH